MSSSNDTRGKRARKQSTEKITIRANDTAKKLVALLGDHPQSNEPYFGEDVSQLDHALQCAKFAADAGFDEHVIVGALLHDIGHLLGHGDDKLESMGDLGTKDHEHVAADYLEGLHLPKKTIAVVRNHVKCKRYLCWKKPAYYNKLSEASKGTLAFQGGPMSKDEGEEFEADPFFHEIIMVRGFDEKAKVVNPKFHVPGLDSYETMIARCVVDGYDEMQMNQVPRFCHYNLTEEQRLKWQDDGYLVLSDVLSEFEKPALVHWVKTIQQWKPEPGKWMCYYEPKPRQSDEEEQDSETKEGPRESFDDRDLMLCRTENFLPFHGALRELLTKGAISNIVEQLFGEPAVLFKEKINYKLPGGGGFPSHQDAPAFNTFGQKTHLSLAIAVDKATPENGCLEVVPGAHQSGVFPQNPIHGGISDEANEQFQAKWVSVPLQVGDVLLFSSLLPHRSFGNTTDKPRRTIYITYNGESDGSFREKYYVEKRKEFPQECEREKGKDYSKGAKTYNVATPIVG